MAILPRIEGPADVKKLTDEQCMELAKELRKTILDTVSKTGGHLASNLGAVELTVAIHRAFDSPRDQILFDVGHQVYAHKLLTGRQEQFHTLRSYHGISGFPCRQESEHDMFDTGHSSTSISMALGLARARDLKGEAYHVVAVVGDGALTGGMCYEAMNDAGSGHTRLIVILNDNAMSISRNVGALAKYLRRLRASAHYYGSKKRIKSRLEKVPVVGPKAAHVIENIKAMVKTVTTGGELFEALGFRYLGPFDGHNIPEMVHIFEEAKQLPDTPVLIHVVTTKGSGYDLAERQPEKYHGTSPFIVENGMKRKHTKENACVQAGRTLVRMAKDDAKIVAVTAAMTGGTGLTDFAAMYPDRFFDVGIAEQHAVSMAAGLARGGYRPYFAVYATFLQRAYDQLIHDVCLQQLPVCILADHAGLVGDDGKTHHGVFLNQMVLSMPGMTVIVPRDLQQLSEAIRLTRELEGPSVVEYPKEGIIPYAQALNGAPLQYGKWQKLREGMDCALLACGRMTAHALEAAERLSASGAESCVIDCCFLRPMDEEMLREVANRPVFTLEEGQEIGGFGAEVARRLIEMGRAPRQIFGIADHFVTHGPNPVLLEECGLMPEQIAAKVALLLQEQE